MKITFAKPQVPTEGAVVVGVSEGRKLSAAAEQLDHATGGGLVRAINASRFEGKKDQTLMVLAPTGLELNRVLLVGLGKPEKLDVAAAQALGGTAVAQLLTAGDAHVAFFAELPAKAKLSPAEFAANVAFGARLRAYRFDKYLTKEKKEDKPSLKKLAVLSDDHSAAKAAFQPLDRVADGVFLTRDVVSEPANVIHPESLAEECKTLAEIGVDVEILGEKQMRKLGMGSLLGVGQGSERESQLVIMRWMGAKDQDAAPVAFVDRKSVV